MTIVTIVSYIVIHLYMYSAGCSKDYMEVYVRNRLISERLVMSSTFQGYGIQTTAGRFCDNRGYSFSLERYSVDFMTVYFHTDGSGSGSTGLNVTFTAVGKYG